MLRATSGVAAGGTSECADVPTSSASAAEVRAAVCGVIADLETAWAAGDAEAYGAPFTRDATYTTFAGTHYVTRAEIVASHAALFDGVLGGTRLDNSYLSLRIPADNVAILTTRGDTYEGERPGTSAKVQTYTFVREGEGWSIAAFHNTQRQPVMERVQFLWMPETRPAAER